MVYKATRVGRVRYKGSLMLSGFAGQRPRLKAVTRVGLLALGLLSGSALTACTTVEGTNALTDIGTFEREVMTETMKGMGMLEREGKDENGNRRGPLVLPKDTRDLPPPVEGDTAAAALPANSDKVEVSTAGLTEDDIKRLRNVRVVEAHSTSGRPLTPDELAQLLAKVKGARVDTSPRPLYFPPEEYFSTVKGQDLVCLAPSGDLVPLTDKACPPDIRRALTAKSG